MASTVDEEENNVEKIAMTEDNNGIDRSPSNGDDLMPQKFGPSLMEIMYEFTQRTTFHGLKLVFRERVGIVRRVIWSLLFVTCTVLMGIQIVNRLLHYYSYPVTVTFNVNFDRMLTFPTVTICNQNMFRATAASSRNWYKIVGDFNNMSARLDSDALEEYNASRLSLEDIYLDTAHRKEDMIVECQWQNEICGSDNFTQVMTDQGVCYSFNGHRGSALTTASTGPGSGLKLTLNVEQYDYMPAPHSPVGVKMLLHNYNQFPRVGELGLAVAAGSHAFVGIDLLKVNNLPKPHGTCQRGPSPHYEEYSPEACQLTCMTLFLDSLCACRHVYLPHKDESPPVCTLEQFNGCLKENMAAAIEHVRDRCSCPAPCDLLQYQPVISYASRSPLATSRLLTPSFNAALRKRYVQARESASHADKEKLQQFTSATNELRSSFRELQNDFNRAIQNSLLNQQAQLSLMYDKMKDVWTKKKYLLDWQRFHVEMNFVKAKEEMEVRTMFYLDFGYQEFSYQVMSRINQLTRDSWNMTISEDVRASMFIEVLNMLNGRMQLVDKAYEDYIQLYDAYSNGAPIFTYQFQNESIDDNDYITPKPLLNESIARHDLSGNDSVTVVEAILNVKDILQAYISLANKSYFDNIPNPGAVAYYNSQFLEWVPKFSQSKSLFYADSLEYPLKIIEEKVREFENRWSDFETTLRPMENKLEMLLSNLIKHQKNILTVLEQNIAKAQWHIAYENVTKLQFAEAITAETITKGIHELTHFFSEFRSRGQEIYDGWSALNQSTQSIWEMILDDDNMVEYYRYFNMTDFLKPFAEVSLHVGRNYSRFRDANNVQHKLSQLEGAFLKSYHKMVAQMQEYMAGCQIDPEFVKNNFLQLDVYYKQKGYEEITQQAAFDSFALLCDIGGTMAFYLGASVLTICELLDLGMHHFLYKLTHGEKLQ